MRKGFTLIELAIVLVVVGLIIAGILVGNSMMETSRISAAIKQFEQLDAATQNFVTKYQKIPGDCGFCGGNVDGYFGTLASPCRDLLPGGECDNFFTNLAATGELNGYQYSSTPPTTTPYNGWIWGSGYSFANNYRTFPQSKLMDKTLILVGQATNRDLFWMTTSTLIRANALNGAVKPEIIMALDIKIDDGAPLTGGVVPLDGPWGGCGVPPSGYPQVLDDGTGTCAGSCVLSGKYKTSNSSIACVIGVRANVEH